MTERLSTMLHDEAFDLPVPAAPTDAILARGRRMRTRRRLGALAAGTAGVVAIAGLAAGITNGPDLRLAADLAAASALDPSGWAVSAGSTVYLGNGARATVPDKVKSIYYTSAGTVVRTGTVAYTDAPDSSYALLTDAGEVHSLGLQLGDRAPSTDPTLPYLAYAEKRGLRGHDDWNVVLLDVRTAQEVVSIPVEGDFTWGGWNAPPVALDGDHVYVALDEATLDVHWRTGEVGTASHLSPAFLPDVDAGHSVLIDDQANTSTVIDVATGRTLMQRSQDEGQLSLSPDGRFALLLSMATCDDDNTCTMDDPQTEVFDVATGARLTTVHLATRDFGWTPDGRLLRADGRGVELCSPQTGACEATGIRLDDGSVKVGGSSYES